MGSKRDKARQPALRPGGYRRARRCFALALAVGLPAIMLLGVMAGSTSIRAAEVLAILWRGLRGSGSSGGSGGSGAPPSDADVHEAIVLQLRLPRVLLAGICGAALAMAGTAFQAVFRNPLADPYILGASTGAALGAAAVVVLGGALGGLGAPLMPAFAFVGALTAVALAYLLARRARGVSTLGLLLAGVVVGAWAGAAVSLLIYFSGRFLAQIVFWLMGGFSAATWRQVLVVLPYVAVGAALLLARAKDLNCLLLGDDTAIGLGVDAERSRRLIVAGASLLTAAAVASSGPIGFVGLLVPHLARLFVGADHWYLLPASAGAGAALMVIADLVARTALEVELPVGVVTALLGGPFFLWLLSRREHYRAPGRR